MQNRAIEKLLELNRRLIELLTKRGILPIENAESLLEDLAATAKQVRQKAESVMRRVAEVPAAVKNRGVSNRVLPKVAPAPTRFIDERTPAVASPLAPAATPPAKQATKNAGTKKTATKKPAAGAPKKAAPAKRTSSKKTTAPNKASKKATATSKPKSTKSKAAPGKKAAKPKTTATAPERDTAKTPATRAKYARKK